MHPLVQGLGVAGGDDGTCPVMAASGPLQCHLSVFVDKQPPFLDQLEVQVYNVFVEVQGIQALTLHAESKRGLGEPGATWYDIYCRLSLVHYR